MIKVITNEKAIKLLEANNTLVLEVDRRDSKPKIKKEIEETFNVKVDAVNTLIRNNQKFVYARLNKKNPAIDVATKLGMI
ncbi:MAG: 50S ribosomal protein L23 [Nanoarchaeota archaeon]